MTEEEKQRILAESRRLLEELANMQPYEPATEDIIEADISDYQTPTWIDELLGPTDPLARFRAEAEAQERRFEKEREAEHARQRRREATMSDKAWKARATAIVARELKRERDEIFEAVGSAVGQILRAAPRRDRAGSRQAPHRARDRKGA